MCIVYDLNLVPVCVLFNDPSIIGCIQSACSITDKMDVYFEGRVRGPIKI